ncbi:MAG: transcription elongation factor GreA [Lachnospiraceae bacterium]|nr:transcription elongation factor GreA [Lachnospiraceae bacterium]
MRDKLTESDIRKMEEEIEYRITELRPKLLEELKEARSHGDLSENFEYHAAKREKNKNEGRIRYLERMIKSAVVIEDSSAEDEVGINNTVTVYFVEDKEEEKYKIVTTVRTNSLQGLISIESPLGKALLGKKEGERVEVVMDNGYSYHVIIRNIDKTTTDEEDEINQF